MKPAAIFLLLVMAAPALAQDISVDTVGTGTTQQFFEPLSGDLMVTDSRSTIDVFEGLDDTPLAGMTARCFGSTTILRGVPRGNGNCVFTDPDGDKVLQSWAVDQVGQGTSSGTWFFVGGTGKHEGIVGRGHFNRYTQNTSGRTETHIAGEARWQ